LELKKNQQKTYNEYNIQTNIEENFKNNELFSNNNKFYLDPDGFYFFDRDWWLFRYILIFLRDGTLPDDRMLLTKLYREAIFWEFYELQQAIEEEKLHLRSNNKIKKTENSWWRNCPSWWNAIDEEDKKKKNDAAVVKAKEDWWTDTSYKGNVFLPLSNEPNKVVTKTGEKDVLPTLSFTWQNKTSY